MGRELSSPPAGRAEVPKLAAIPSVSSRPQRNPSECGLVSGVSGSHDRAESRTGTPCRSFTRTRKRNLTIGPVNLY